MTFPALPLQAVEINFMSFNIRYDNPADGDNAWPKRSDKVVSTILFHQTDIAGLQEVLHGQLQLLKDEMPGYDYVGVGRDDGKQAGEYSPIFYRKDKFLLKASGTFWLSPLSETPGSRGWDAAATRIVTWARFYSRNTGDEFLVFNTHFDHKGKEARAESASLLRKKIDEMNTESYPVIITGDLNCESKEKPFKTLAKGKDGFIDSYKNSQLPHHGPKGSMSRWKEAGIDDKRIDYILYRGSVEVKRHAHLGESWNGRFASDHLAVFGTLDVRGLRLKNKGGSSN